MIESLLPTMEEDGTANEVKKRFIYIGENYEDYKDNCYIGLAKTKDKVNTMEDSHEDTPVEGTGKTSQVKTLSEWKQAQDNQQGEQSDNKVIKDEDNFKNVVMLNASFNEIADTFWDRDTFCFFSLSPFYLQKSSFFSMQYKSSGESDGSIVLVPYSAISNLSESSQKAEKIMEIVAPYKSNQESAIIDNEVTTYQIDFDNIYTSKFIIQCILCEDKTFPPDYYICVLLIPFDSGNWNAPELYRFLSIR